MGAAETSRLFNPSGAGGCGQQNQRDGSATVGGLVFKSSYCVCRSVNILRIAWSWVRSRMGASVPAEYAFALRFPASSRMEKSCEAPYKAAPATMTVPVHKSAFQT